MGIMNVIIRNLTQAQDYTCTWEAMKQFTIERDQQSTDEIWLLEHPPVFTQGQSGQDKHILKKGGSEDAITLFKISWPRTEN